MKKIRVLAIAVLLVIAGAFLLTNENLFKADVTEETVIENGVYIGGIDVSGMNTEEATEAVNHYVEDIKAKSISLVGPKGSISVSLEKMGLTARTGEAVSEALAVGQSGNLIKRFKELRDLETQHHVVDMGLAIDKQETAEILHNRSSRIDIKAIDNGLKIEDGEFVYVPGQDGNEVDIPTAVNELNEYIGTEWELAAVEDAKFTLTSEVSHPRGSEEELSVVRDLMGSFTTNYKSSGAGRAKNVENGASKIHGTILYPGDELSVYELVNPFTQENGYELAGSYLNGETVESFGGGICQVSTTLYNAALNAELEITQRFNHSMIVTYVDPAADAAIAGTYKDLRFKNPYDFPVYIEAAWKNRNITFNIYGKETRPANRKVEYVSEVLSENDPPTEYTISYTDPAGTFLQTRGKHVGYVAQLWKVVTVDGVEKERTKVNKSTYQASARKVTIGVAGANDYQIMAINNAIASGDDATVQATVTSMGAPVIVAPVAPAPAPEETPVPETPSAGEEQPEN